MPTSRRSPSRPTDGASGDRLRITEGGLEVVPATTAERDLLRRLTSLVNGPASAQPYLVEETEGHFRLYVGDAAERARTAQGIIDKKGAEREGFEPSVEL